MLIVIIYTCITISVFLKVVWGCALHAQDYWSLGKCLTLHPTGTTWSRVGRTSPASVDPGPAHMYIIYVYTYVVQMYIYNSSSNSNAYIHIYVYIYIYYIIICFHVSGFYGSWSPTHTHTAPAPSPHSLCGGQLRGSGVC